MEDPMNEPEKFFETKFSKYLVDNALEERAKALAKRYWILFTFPIVIILGVATWFGYSTSKDLGQVEEQISDYLKTIDSLKTESDAYIDSMNVKLARLSVLEDNFSTSYQGVLGLASLNEQGQNNLNSQKNTLLARSENVYDRYLTLTDARTDSLRNKLIRLDSLNITANNYKISLRKQTTLFLDSLTKVINGESQFKDLSAIIESADKLVDAGLDQVRILVDHNQKTNVAFPQSNIVGTILCSRVRREYSIQMQYFDGGTIQESKGTVGLGVPVEFEVNDEPYTVTVTYYKSSKMWITIKKTTAS